MRALRRLPNDSIVVALRGSVVLAAREVAAAACVAAVFLVGALLAVVFAAGAFVAVVFFAGAFVAEGLLAGAFVAVLFFAGAFVAVAAPAAALRPAGAFLAVAFVGAAFAVVAFTVVAFAAVAFAVGRRVGEAVADTAFLRAVRADVGVGFPPGDFAAVAPVARFVAVATFFAATLAGGGALRAPVCFRARPACAILAPRDLAWRTVFPTSGRSNTTTDSGSWPRVSASRRRPRVGDAGPG
ncbi:hypothetical protein [Micromonospora qiuiae]|uniref:hypothetical protein n=1 Tax=Micromonospora qiuiae TaxID=502268 RepID=UPI0019516B18|nr:hypothetical protein [Micromonospora qiuiae]